MAASLEAARKEEFVMLEIAPRVGESVYVHARKEENATPPGPKITPRRMDESGLPLPFRRLRARWLRWKKPRWR